MYKYCFTNSARICFIMSVISLRTTNNLFVKGMSVTMTIPLTKCGQLSVLYPLFVLASLWSGSLFGCVVFGTSCTRMSVSCALMERCICVMIRCVVGFICAHSTLCCFLLRAKNFARRISRVLPVCFVRGTPPRHTEFLFLGGDHSDSQICTRICVNAI